MSSSTSHPSSTPSLSRAAAAALTPAEKYERRLATNRRSGLAARTRQAAARDRLEADLAALERAKEALRVRRDVLRGEVEALRDAAAGKGGVEAREGFGEEKETKGRWWNSIAAMFSPATPQTAKREPTMWEDDGVPVVPYEEFTSDVSEPSLYSALSPDDDPEADLFPLLPADLDFLQPADLDALFETHAVDISPPAASPDVFAAYPSVDFLDAAQSPPQKLQKLQHAAVETTRAPPHIPWMVELPEDPFAAPPADADISPTEFPRKRARPAEGSTARAAAPPPRAGAKTAAAAAATTTATLLVVSLLFACSAPALRAGAHAPAGVFAPAAAHAAAAGGGEAAMLPPHFENFSSYHARGAAWLPTSPADDDVAPKGGRKRGKPEAVGLSGARSARGFVKEEEEEVWVAPRVGVVGKVEEMLDDMVEMVEGWAEENATAPPGEREDGEEAAGLESLRKMARFSAADLEEVGESAAELCAS